MWVDHDHVEASPPQHGSRGRAGEPAARDDDIRVPHGRLPVGRPIIAIKTLKESLKWPTSHGTTCRQQGGR
jgi:hypothetical protein